MSRRPSTMFRGSELPRLLFLVAIVLAGWPMFLLFAGGRVEPKAPPAPELASALPPVIPDDGIEFQALVDRRPMQVRENAAYSSLIRRTRETPAQELAGQARRDLFFAHFWGRPERYRGVPVHIEGTALRVLRYEVNPELAPAGQIYEAWVYPDESASLPYVLIFEEPPAGLVVGPDLHLRVSFDGYFLKILGYRAGDKGRGAPMFVGRLHATPAQPAAPGPIAELQNLTKRDGFVIVFVLLFAYVVVRGIFQVRRALAPRRALSAAGRTLANDEIGPEELAGWLRSIPDEDGGKEMDDPPLDKPARPIR